MDGACTKAVAKAQDHIVLLQYLHDPVELLVERVFLVVCKHPPHHGSPSL